MVSCEGVKGVCREFENLKAGTLAIGSGLVSSLRSEMVGLDIIFLMFKAIIIVTV